MAISQQLELLQRRWRLRATLRGTLVGILAALVLFVSLRTAQLLLPPGSMPDFFEPSLVVALALALFVGLVSLVSALVARWRSPTLLQLAVAADKQLGLHERLSTALELNGFDSGLVVHALREDATSRLPMVSPSALIPIRAPRWAWVLPLLLILSTALSALPTTGNGVPVDSGSASGEEPAAAELAEPLRRIARLLSESEEVEQDQYLRAVATGFDELGRRLEAEEVTSAEAREELRDLLDQLAEAAARSDSMIARDLGDAIAGAVDDAGEEATGPNASNSDFGQGDGALPPSDDGQTDTSARTVESGGSTVSVDSGPDDLLRSLNAVLNELERHSQAAVPTVAPNSGNDDGSDAQVPSQHYLEAAYEQATVAAERQRGLVGQQQAAGAPVGAAERSNDQAGDAAGDGAQPLDAGAPGFDLEELETGREQVPLPWSEDEDGKRLSLEVEPETAHSTPAEVDASVAEGFRPAQETAPDRDRISLSYRDIVTRYFLPPGAGSSGVD